MKWVDNLRQYVLVRFYVAITHAIFNFSGTTPDESEQLKRYANGPDNKNLSV